MYIKSIRLRNIKCFEDVALNFPHKEEDYSGWIVLLGENGTGKTTILQGIAGALITSARNRGGFWPTNWLRNLLGNGRIDLHVHTGKEDFWPNRWGFWKTTSTDSTEGLKFHTDFGVNLKLKNTTNDWTTTFDPEQSEGWLICGYGPFRRFTKKSVTVSTAGINLRFLTLLDDELALPDAGRFLTLLYTRTLDEKVADHDKARKVWKPICDVVNALLPEKIQLGDINSERVNFTDKHDTPIAIASLSDGYRSFLSLTLDFLEYIYESVSDFPRIINYDSEGYPQLLVEGVVLIDEADAHLHPRWQRELGLKLRRVFPKIQFIVTTHSPFIAQEASENGLFVLNSKENGTVEVSQPVDSVQGWPVSQILTSPLFGLTSTRDPKTDELLRKHSELKAIEQFGKLNAKQKKELQLLSELLKTRLTAPGETLADRQRYEEMDRYVEETLQQLRNGK